jgi:hypothetical protein
MSTISNLPHPGAGALDRNTVRPADLEERFDRLDALIWHAARTSDDPQLAVGQAREYADGVFVGLVIGAGSGTHRLNCSVPTASGPLTAGEDLRFEIAAEVPAVILPGSGAEREVCELFALAHVSRIGATAILRSRPLPLPSALASDLAAHPDPDPGPGPGPGSTGYVVRGWRLADGRSTPIDAAGMFSFCCSEASSGEPLPLDPSTRYVDARALLTPPRPG